MSDVNHNICREVNDFYFRCHGRLSLIIPDVFSEISEEGACIAALRKHIEQQKYDEAVAAAEDAIARFPESANDFLVWQIFAYWKQGKLPDTELIEYFTTLEEIYPQEAYINYDKALLLTGIREYTRAVQELVAARRKDPHHLPSTSLLFLIYYMAEDPQWRGLFGAVKAGGLLDEKTMRPIEIGEALREKKEIPGFLQASRHHPREENEKLLRQFPALAIVREPTAKNIIFVAADGRNYLRLFAATFLMSALEVKDRDFGVHIHIYDPMGVDLEWVETYAEKFPALDISYSYEKASLTLPTEDGHYYAPMRFPRAQQLLEKYEKIENLAITDVDALVRSSPFPLKGLAQSDITLTGGTEKGPYWDRLAAGFTCFCRTAASREAFAFLAQTILRNALAGKMFWFIDQIALYDMRSKYQKDVAFNIVSGDVIFGKNLEQKEGSYFWTYTNDEKIRDNPMNRERARLMKEYGIQEDWNVMARGKYGTVVANRNDAYIGRQLLAHGAWCDHEIKILRQILDKGDTVVEVGSNIGSHTLPLAKAVGNSGRLIAMEPQRILFQTLCANIALNSLRNVTALNVACGEKEGWLKVAELDPTREQNFGGYQPKNAAGEVPVPVITLDSLNLDSCRLIKMDIEGMELEAMKGAGETLARCEPVLFFESHGEAVREIAAYLGTIGYRVYDFGLADDPMYLAVREKDAHWAQIFNIAPLAI